MSTDKDPCLYCDTELEPAMGLRGVCPKCYTQWGETEYVLIKGHPCPGCAGYPQINDTPEKFDFICYKCKVEYNAISDNVFIPENDNASEVPLFDWDSLMGRMEEELVAADAKYGPMKGPIGGLGTIECEFVELSREVNQEVKSREDTEKECLQLMTVCAKFMRDVIPMIKDTTPTTNLSVKLEGGFTPSQAKEVSEYLESKKEEMTQIIKE